MAIRKSSISGIPKGNTANRSVVFPSPSNGDVYYNGTNGFLEIYTSSGWVASSAVPAVPSISVADVGTGIAYGSAQGAVTITPGTSGGIATSYLISSSSGGYTATTSQTTTNITVGNSGSWTFSAQGISGSGTSLSSPTISANLTTLPQAPTIGAAGAGNEQATVTFTANNDGGSAITSYTVTSSPGNITASGASSPITVTGLTNGTAYTFTVKAQNANGLSLPSAASNSVTPDDTVTVNYLVLAGGGGNNAGAGGLRSTVDASGRATSPESPLVLDLSTNYTVTVGSGGASGFSGNNSVFSTITSLGGGVAGVGGGCGGGGNNGSPPPAAPLGTAGQGFDGGQGANTSGQGIGGSAGGTGSAGGVGKPGTGNTGNPGGNGTSVSITGSTVVYGGGGAPGGNKDFQNNLGGAGGTGGGGNGAAFGGANIPGQNGGTNLGGGGGGDGWAGTSQPGGAGGSGVVILRYPSSFTLTVGAGLTSSTNIVGTNKVTSFTAGSGNVSWS